MLSYYSYSTPIQISLQKKTRKTLKNTLFFDVFGLIQDIKK